jgi:D-glycero-alpha-D-manno-heptose-7-phosphate kinase
VASTDILVRTPLRISFVGGGTDLRDYYSRSPDRPGQVVSLAIDRYCFTTVRPRRCAPGDLGTSAPSDPGTLDPSDYVARLIRAAMADDGAGGALDVTVATDGPTGAGLGASSSLAVGIVHALAAARGRRLDAQAIAARACALEIDVLGRPIGKQDAYIAAFGGFRRFTFHADERVTTAEVACSLDTRSALLERLLLFFTGATREAESVLSETRASLRDGPDGYARLSKVGSLVPLFLDAMEKGDIAAVGPLLQAAWAAKKSTSPRVTNDELDDLYAAALAAGASGGKLLGAGNGGCLLLFAEPGARERVRDVLRERGAIELSVGAAESGSEIVPGD